MTALITVRDGQGAIIGRCDQKCYGAREPACDCICFGTNHGRGRQEAEKNTERLADQWVERARGKDWAIADVELGEPITQQALFDI